MALYSNKSASGAIKSGAGRLHKVIVNSHSSGTLRFNDGASGTTSAGVKATGVLTGSGVFSDGETVTIGDETYTFKTALTASGVPNEVLIGANLATSLDNLKVAINGGAGEGTAYGTGTVANVQVTATTNTDTAQTVEATRVGTYANAFGTTEACANASWGASTLENGAEPSLLMFNTITFSAGSGIELDFGDVAFSTGLYVTVGGTIDYTVIYD